MKENGNSFACLVLLTSVLKLFAQSITVTFCGYSSSDNLPVELDSVYIYNCDTGEDTTIYGPMELAFVIPSSGASQPRLFPSFKAALETPGVFYNLQGCRVPGIRSDKRIEPFTVQVLIEKRDGFQRRIVAVDKNQFTVPGQLEKISREFRDPVGKRAEFSASDSFLFVGFADGYITDTIARRSVYDGELLEFKFTAQTNGRIWYDWVYYSRDSLVTWGFGNTEQAYRSNDRKYNWYVDQANTGTHSNSNCGPSSAEMASRWADSLYTGSAEEARSLFRPEGGWWYTSDVISYLTLHNIPNHTVRFDNTSNIRELIDQGNILISCLTTAELRRNTNNAHRVDRFYSYGDGHFLVIKGYRIVNDSALFEVYDPNNWNAKYSDNSQKGKNRHYRESDMSNAISKWWNYLIVVSEKGTAAKRMPFKNVVDPDTIEHARGR